MKSVMGGVHRVLTLFISLGVFVQMLLAGIWHAHVVSTPDAHVFFGLSLLLASLLALLAAIFGGMGRRAIGLTGLLFVLILLQPILIEQRRAGLPALSALHTLNAAFIGMVGSVVMRVSRGDVVAQDEVEPDLAGLAGLESGD